MEQPHRRRLRAAVGRGADADMQLVPGLVQRDRHGPRSRRRADACRWPPALGPRGCRRRRRCRRRSSAACRRRCDPSGRHRISGAWCWRRSPACPSSPACPNRSPTGSSAARRCAWRAWRAAHPPARRKRSPGWYRARPRRAAWPDRPRRRKPTARPAAGARRRELHGLTIKSAVPLSSHFGLNGAASSHAPSRCAVWAHLPPKGRHLDPFRPDFHRFQNSSNRMARMGLSSVCILL